jgi:hypothetical protein
VSDSAYELLYDFVRDLHRKGLGFCLSFGEPLKPLVNTFQGKLAHKLIANRLVQEIVHGIVRQFVRQIARVDSYIG